jgi:hypothetical protein
LSAAPLAAQTAEFGGWAPIGPAPVDQAGAGRRGYALPGESSDVAAPQSNQVAFHMVGANNFFIDDSSPITISERSESHTLAFDFRRGFRKSNGPRFEIGAQIQMTESDAGVLNGFIAGFEDMVHAPLRSVKAPPPLGTSVSRNGRAMYASSGEGSGLGDVYVVAKLALHDAPETSRDARIAGRVAVNLSGASAFTLGNFVGVGLSLDKKLNEWVAFHGDLRTSLTLDSVSAWGLPLTRTSAGFSIGPELRIAENTSMNLQFDGSSSPYQLTGTTSLDAGYGDAVLGVNHRFLSGARQFVTQFYARENLVLPFNVRWNADPDFAVGFKVSVR